jgi:putative ABC transport system permease protein
MRYSWWSRQSSDPRGSALSLVGIDPAAARAVRAYPITTGRFLTAGDSASAVISQTLADLLSVKAGDAFPIPTTNGIVNLTVVGILPPRTVPGNEEVLVTLPQAQAMADQPGQINTIDLNLNSTDAARRSQILSTIQSTLGTDFTIGSLSSGSDLIATLRLGQELFSLFGVLALFMGAFIILNTFRTIVVERRRDIGMLRTIGSTQKQVRHMVVTEALILAGIGTAFGLAAGPYLGYVLVLAVGTIFPLGYAFPTAGIIAGIVIGLGFGALAAIIPARQAARLQIVQALRYE